MYPIDQRGGSGERPTNSVKRETTLFGSGAGEEVVVHFSALGAEGIEVAILRTHVERRAVGVIEERGRRRAPGADR